MQKVRVPQNSFQFGEVSDSLIMRTDTGVYTGSAQKVENMIVTAEGGAKKRQGLKHIYDYSISYDASNTDQSRLFPFIFDSNEQYIISIEHAKVRCFRVVDADTITLVATLTADASSAALPFDKQYLHQITTAQMGDVMFICHPLFAPRLLTRTSLTDFNISTYTFDNRSDFKKTYQPYSRFHPAGQALNPAATSGSNVIVTVSTPYFDITGSQSGGNYPDSLHVGVKLRYSGNEAQIVSVQSTTQAKVNISDTFTRRMVVNNPLRTHDGSQKVEVTMINHGLFVGGGVFTLSDCDTVGGIAASNLNITTVITSIIDENTFTFNANAAATSSEDGGGFPTFNGAVLNRDWDEQSWSAKRGYPAAVAFHENRLVFAGTIAEPDSIFMSKIGEYFNHDTGEALDNEAINLTAATGDVHEIRHLVSSRDLQVFAGTGELYVPTFLNQSITPTNAQIREQTPYGSSFAQPALIDGATIFAQASGKIIREYLFTDNEDAYASTAISTISSHLINNPKYISVVHSGFDQPDSYAVMSMTDGDAAVFTSNRAEKRASWTEFTTNGRFDSVIAIDDRLFANIYDANNKLKLCEFKGDIGLDSYIYGAISSNAITVSSAYANGVTVDVIATNGTDNDYLGEFTVAAGAVSLLAFSTAGYTHAYVGKKFTSKIISNPIDASGAAGPLTGSLRGITNVVVDIKDTRSIKVNSKPVNIEESFTGKKEIRLIGYDRDPKVTIEQDNPLSMQVNGFITEVII